MGAIETITGIFSNAPLHAMIEEMGVAVAKAQAALDANSIRTLQALAEQGLEVNGQKTNLLQLGFVPTFYAFTEASFEMKMEFSMAESDAFSIAGSASLNSGSGAINNQNQNKRTGMVAASINASYSRKFDQSASASSSIAARMVSLPPPENLLELLKTIQPTT